jgi:hypothetical protein
MRPLLSQWRWLLVIRHHFRPGPDQRMQALVGHRHIWGPCKWNGQYYYARCLYSESCTARIAC